MKNSPPQQRLLIGVFILIIGVLALAGNLNILNTREIIPFFWPAVLIVFGTMKLSQARSNASLIIGGGAILLGTTMALNTFGIISIRIRDFWPVVLIVAGLIFIFKEQSTKAFRDFTGNTKSTSQLEGNDAKIDIVTVMSGNQSRITSQEFVGGSITAIMGGAQIDLRNASIQTEAALDLTAFWGGIVLKIPSDWTVTNNGVALLGAIVDTSVPAMNASKRLIITGTAIMGGVEIKN